VIIYFIAGNAGMKDNMRMHARYLDGVHNKEPKMEKKRTQDAPMRSKSEIIITAARLIS
jgi:hypothetical protein